MSQPSRRGSSVIDPEKVIPTFSIPWIHRDAWNDKEWFYAIEGVWYLISSENMEKILEMFGVGPNTISMLSRADMMLSLQEHASYEWWVRYEYRIKGKNHIGCFARANKLTSNLFFPGHEKAEALDDWDKRFVDTTASLLKNSNRDEDEKARLVLNQEADKEFEFHFNSEIVFEAPNETLVMTTTVFTNDGPIIGTRTFSRYDLDQLLDIVPNPDRRPSFCMAQNIARRGSFATTNLKAPEALHEDILHQLGARSRRRSSVAKVPEHLLPLIINTEASESESDHESENFDD